MKQLFIFSLFFFSVCLSAQTIKININGIREKEGNIRLVFYTDSKSFDDEKAYLIKEVSKSSMQNGMVSVTYAGIKAGTYGIAILDDENENDKMDYGMILPKEGFGFSNYYHTGMTRPKFESFDFVLDKKDVTVEIKLRYL
jgi:uncharacterized protein (DUF2141 family)